MMNQLDEEIKSSLASRFGVDLWMNLRFRLAEVTLHLESLKQFEQNSSQIIADWLSFVRFLDSECAGKNFQNDKQWSELMNLMEISRKLNHRTVKFGDILKSKNLIEANASSIRQLNESAKLGQTIKASLDELDSLIQSCRLEMIAPRKSSLSSSSRVTHARQARVADDKTRESSQQGPPFLLDALSAALSHLQDKCQPLIYTVRLGMEDEEMLVAHKTDVWKDRLEKHEQFVRKISSFLTNLRQLQAKLAHLRPLMMCVSDKDNTMASKQQPARKASLSIETQQAQKLATSSIASCQQKFKLILEFHDRLIESLYTLSAAQRTPVAATTRVGGSRKSSSSGSQKSIDLPLHKLLNAKGEFINTLCDSDLSKALRELENCHSELDKIMRTLRMEFGRFYFVNDVELLTIIALDSRLVLDNFAFDEQNTAAGKSNSNSSGGEKQRLLSKLFNNSISGFEIRGDGQYLIGVRSPFGERILLSSEEQPVAIKKQVNMYSVEIVRILNETIRKLRRTLKSTLINSLRITALDDIDYSLPVQLMNLSEQIKFCQRVEEAFQSKEPSLSIDNLVNFYERRFRKLSSMEKTHSDDSESAPDDNNWLLEFKESAAISLTVYFISLLNTIQLNKVTSSSEWHWQKQVRYYLISLATNDGGNTFTREEVETRIADTKFMYKFDYLPLQADDQSQKSSRPTFKRLISTQITHRCFLLASQSVCNFRLGAQPYGPAGSGKTETVKALGHLLGCQVIVHNCDVSNDSESLDKLIWGLAHTGLWGCFDEFNRLSSSVLSSVSATLELVQRSVRENRTTVELPTTGQLMCIDRDSAFFVTLNPGDGIKYRGRRRLPANLRSLFLPVSMVRTQIDSIVSENLLTLSAKMNNSGSLGDFKASEALSFGKKLYNWIEWMKSQNVGSSLETGGARCEWDLRLVMAILRRLKILATRNSSQSEGWPIEKLLLKSIEYEVVTRLTTEEQQVMHKGIEEIFNPMNIQPTANDNGNNGEGDGDENSLGNRINMAIVSKGLKLDSDGGHSERLASALSSQLETRTGVLLSGAPGSGKSTSWQVLHSAEGGNLSIRWLAVNQKACDKRLLFGYVDSITRKWIDGLLTLKVREAQALLQTESLGLRQVWLILDGPIDPDWIESLNSVLDDNQVLTLSSGERLDFCLPQNKSIKLIFETTDLKFASPATTSRLGLVYYEHQAFRLKGTVNTIKTSHLSEQQQYLGSNKSYDCVAINNAIALTSQGDNEESAADGVKIIGKWQNEHRLAKIFLTNSNGHKLNAAKLLIISGASNLNTKLSFIREILFDIGGFSGFIEYQCSQFSNSSHLNDLVLSNRNSGNLCYVINNVQLIQNEDQWETKSFLELLRFILTYNGFYDQSDSAFRFMPINNNAKFVLTVDSLENIEPRLLSLANVADIDHQNSPEKQLDEPVELIDQVSSNGTTGFRLFLSTTFQQEWRSPIVCLSCETRGSGRRQTILDVFQTNWTLFTFQNSRLAAQSFDYMEKLLLSNNKKEPKQLKRANLFILSDFECHLMEQNLKAKLFHLLNRLRDLQRVSKFLRFIYLSHNIHRKREELAFWSSMGRVYHFANQTEETILINLKQKLRTKLSDESSFLPNDFVASNNQKEAASAIDWLVSRVEAFFILSPSRNGRNNSLTADCSDLCSDKRRLDFFLSTLTALISKFRDNLLGQRRTLANGLSRLSDFEQSIEQVKMKCKSDERKLEAKRQEIEQLMHNIELALQGERGQMIEINDLRRKQEIKTREIKLKSEKVERELAKVLPLVESSKSEISQYLKPEAMNEIKTLRSPPKTIKDILDVLFILLKIEDSSWNSIKSQLSKYSFKDQLTSYDFNKNLTANLLAKVEAQIASHRESFDPRQAARASKAIVPILGWIQATVEYGRVLTKLGPLNSEMDKLKDESELIRSAAQKLEAQHEEISARTAADSAKLKQLRQESDEAQTIAASIESKLNKAQQARAELEDQVNRWRSRLTFIESLLKGNELNQLCLAVSSIALLFRRAPANMTAKSIEDFLKLCELTLTVEEFVVRLLNLMADADNFELASESPFKPNELAKVIQLLVIQSLLFVPRTSGSDHHAVLFPFIDLGGSSDQQLMNENELKDFLSFRGVLCQAPKDISVIRCDELNDSTQSIELALRLNKLVVLNLRSDLPALDLDLMDLIQSKSAAASNAGAGLRLILMGQLREHPLIEHLVRPIDLPLAPARSSDSAANSDSSDQIRSAIMMSLIEFYDPKLNERTSHLERELKAKQAEMQRMEVSLLKRLATIEFQANINSQNTNQGESFGLREDVVKVISDLNKLSAALMADVEQLRVKMKEIQSRQADYSKLSLEAAQFYTKFLANLGQADKFYHVSLETYTKWLIAASERRTDSDGSAAVIDYANICSRVMLAMRPEFRSEFQRRLGRDKVGSNSLVERQQAATCESQLERTILDLLGEGEHTEGGASTPGGNSGPKLMVVLHDASKSSPQVEIDELFRDFGRRNWHHSWSPSSTRATQVQYSKVYATEESSERVEIALERLLSDDEDATNQRGSSSNNNFSDSKAVSSSLSIADASPKAARAKKCLCVVNAHLASRWINARLVKLMQSSAAGSQAVCILVGESSSSTAAAGAGGSNLPEDGLDLGLLNFAQVKYWHDELTLSITNRFDLYARSIQLHSSTADGGNININSSSQQQGQLDGHTLQGDSTRESLRASDGALLLSQQLILFHVVCQERAKPLCDGVNNGKAIGWSQSYSFDHDQLSLAFKILRKLCDHIQSSDSSQPGTAAAAAASGYDLRGDLQRLRRLFCHYIEDIIYGARLETLEDERQLSELIERFVGSAESAKLELAKFEQLKTASRAAGAATSPDGGSRSPNSGQQQLDKLVVDFIGSSRNTT